MNKIWLYAAALLMVSICPLTVVSHGTMAKEDVVAIDATAALQWFKGHYQQLPEVRDKELIKELVRKLIQDMIFSLEVLDEQEQALKDGVDVGTVIKRIRQAMNFECDGMSYDNMPLFTTAMAFIKTIMVIPAHIENKRLTTAEDVIQIMPTLKMLVQTIIYRARLCLSLIEADTNEPLAMPMVENSNV